jgi:hypothetical protein
VKEDFLPFIQGSFTLSRLTIGLDKKSIHIVLPTL